MNYICISLSSLNSSSPSIDVTPKCFLRNRYHALCMMFMRFWYLSFGFLNESNTVTRDQSISITSRIQWKLLIHTWLEEMLDIYTLIGKLKWLKKVKGLTWSCTETEWMCDRSAHSRPWIYYSQSDLARCVHSPHVYHLGPWSLCCGSRSSGIPALSSCTVTNKRRGWESKET